MDYIFSLLIVIILINNTYIESMDVVAAYDNYYH
jgi:hypothetical protein